VKDASIPPDLTTQMRPAIEQDLQLSTTLIDPEIGAGMRQMISYHFGWGDSADPSRGKRLRPLLHLLSCAAAGGEWSIALPTASCIELIHNFTLIHDDIEDNSQLRRGRQTVWHVYGVPQAINTGDAMLILAQLSHQRLAASGVDPATVLAVHGIIDRACLDLTLGQFLDLAFESRPMVDQPAGRRHPQRRHYCPRRVHNLRILQAVRAPPGACLSNSGRHPGHMGHTGNHWQACRR
jgi:geranylgeranyl diphosphate synthase type I